MILHDNINEAKELSLEKNFANSLLQVFSVSFIKKIEDKIHKNIKVKIKDLKDPSKAAYTIGKTIYINENIFNRLSEKEKTKYLLHEFIHVLQNKKNFYVFKTFKEVYELGNSLYKTIYKYSKKPVSFFLIGRKEKIQNIKLEIIPYLINNSINWEILGEKGKKEFVQKLQDSKMFNLNSSFWRERI